MFVLFISFYLVRKNTVYRDSNSRPNVSEGYEVTSELPGRPANNSKVQCSMECHASVTCCRPADFIQTPTLTVDYDRITM